MQKMGYSKYDDDDYKSDIAQMRKFKNESTLSNEKKYWGDLEKLAINEYNGNLKKAQKINIEDYAFKKKEIDRPFALFPRDFIFTPGNPLIPLNQGQLNSKTAEKTRDRILREYIKQFRADGLHWLLLCHLRALAGKSNPVYISCTALARRLSSSGKADGRWLDLTKDALVDLEGAELISLEDEHKKRMIITIAPIVINEGKHGYIKVYLSSANKLRSNACLAFCFLLKCQPAKRIINGWYLTTIAKKIGLSYGHDRSRMRQWLHKHLSIINKEILSETHKNYKMKIKGRPAKVYIELI